MSTGTKLAIAVVLLGGATLYMAYLGAKASWQYYLTPEECLAHAGRLRAKRVRVGGKVALESLQVAADRSQATFSLQGAEEKLPVICSGPLPDNLAEGIDVVVEGRLEASGLLRGDKVLTRCAGKYLSRESSVSSENAAQAGS